MGKHPWRTSQELSKLCWGVAMVMVLLVVLVSRLMMASSNLGLRLEMHSS